MLDVLRHLVRAVAILAAIGGPVAYAQQPPQPPPPPAQEPSGDPQPAGVGSATAPPQPEQNPAGDAAQDQPVAPLPSQQFTGLFGGAAPANRQRDSLDLMGSLFAANLTQRPVGPAAAGDPTNYGTSNYGGGSAGLDYNRAWQHANLGLGGFDSLAYVSDLTDEQGGPWVNRWSVNGDASFDHRLSQRASVNGAVMAIYSPYYSQGLLTPGNIPSLGPPGTTPGLDFVVADNPSITSTFTGGLSYNLTQHGSLQFQYALTRHDFLTNESDSLRDQNVLGRYVYQVNRYVGVHAGYGYRTSRTGSSEPTNSHEIDAGADAGRGYQLARRTTFSFNTGSSVFVSPTTTQPGGGSSNGSTRFFFLGNANLVQRWARSWSANVGAGQNVQYEPGFQGPIFSQDAYAGFGGLITTRLDFQTQATYTTGTVGFESAGNGYGSSTATSTLRFAFTSRLAAFAQGFYYKYSFESGVALPTYLQPGLQRYGVSVGLTSWIPLLSNKGHR
jgi:hypothetical protein